MRVPAPDDWWDSPLETALVAVSATRHASSHREQAERAVARLVRWQRDREPRRISADAAALALAAQAAHDLALTDPELARAAIHAVDDLARRGDSVVPALHLALAAWSLDRVQPDRTLAPWPTILTRDSTRRGLAGPLVGFTRALASARFDAPTVVRDMLNALPVSPGTNDSASVLWLLTATVERCSGDIDRNEPGLQALVDRRAELTGRLAQELDRTAFEPPDVHDFDPDVDDVVGDGVYISRLEALLLDTSLASSDPEAPWLRYEEATALFGRQAAHERVLRVKTAQRLTNTSAVFTAVMGITIGVSGWLALIALDVGARIAVPAAILIAGFGVALAAAIWGTARGGKVFPAAVGSFGLILSIGAALVIVNDALAKPLFPDLSGLIGGALLVALATLVFAGLVAVVRDRDESRK